MGINFPNTPAVNDIWPVPAVPGVPQYKWNGTAWVTAVAGDLPPVASVIVSDTPPPAPVDGAFWWESDTGILQIRYNDGVGPAQWVQAAGQATIDTSAFPPYSAMAYSGMQFNGGAEISQEKGAGTTTTHLSYIVDGWKLIVNGGPGVTATPALNFFNLGFPGFIAINVSIAVPTLAAADVVGLISPIEGYRVARLMWGLSAVPQPITIGFWTGHSKPGLYSVSVRNAAANRSYVTIYTHVAANTSQYNVVTIPGDVAGSWNITNSTGIEVIFCAASGSTSIAASANTWLAGNYVAATGQTNCASTTSDVFRITGLIVLPGICAPTAAQSPNIMRPYDQELLTCMRYFQTYDFLGAGCWLSPIDLVSGYRRGFFQFNPVMRIAPQVTVTGGTSTAFVASQPSTSAVTPYSCSLQGDVSPPGYSWIATIKADARL